MAIKRTDIDIEGRVAKRLASKRARLVKAGKYLPEYIDAEVAKAEDDIRYNERMKAVWKLMEDIGKEAGLAHDANSGFFLRPVYNSPEQLTSSWLRDSVEATHDLATLSVYLNKANCEIAFYSDDITKGDEMADRFEAKLKEHGIPLTRGRNPANGGKAIIMVDA